ncbi:MAG TPA: S9 family peptidase, partial [Bacteroidetes bacterium]|nr:S9 family peptidase [Bacteroidota bacterium]
MKVKYVILTLLILTASPVLSQSTATQLSLDVKTIMQDPAWIGSQPSRPYWSEDGKTIYFYWNPENADADSLYRIGIGGGEPEKVSLREQKSLPASSGVYDRSYTRKLFSRNGDIFIYDLKKKKLRRLMKTTDAETSPRFSHDEKSVIYRVGGKLYRYSLRDGTITQIVEIKSGKKKEEPKEPKDPAEKFVRSEQLSLIEVLAERTAKKERAKKAREAGSDKVPVYYVGPFSIMQMQLSPDGRYVTLNLREKKGGGKRTIVPNYVTESGYTEDIPSRSKVGGKQAKTKLMIVDLQADTLFTVKPDDLPEIFTIRPYTTVS